MVGRHNIDAVKTVLLLVCLYAVNESLLVQSSQTYIKLFPGKELCLSYDVYVNTEGEPVTVAFHHRAIDPRLIGIRTLLYKHPLVTTTEENSQDDKMGERVQLDEGLNTFGQVASLYFKATESGIYTLCMRTPLRHPVVRFEVSFVAANDIVEPVQVEDGVPVVDKEVEMRDYDTRLHMLETSLESTVDELRMYQTRRFAFDLKTDKVFYLVLGSTLLNALFALLFSVYSQRYIKKSVMKLKTL